MPIWGLFQACAAPPVPQWHLSVRKGRVSPYKTARYAVMAIIRGLLRRRPNSARSQRPLHASDFRTLRVALPTEKYEAL